MSKTKIIIKTKMCPLGIGKLGQEGACRFHREEDNLPEDGKCPIHKLDLGKAILNEDRITKTVMGEEDIEPEIEDRDETKHKVKRLAEIDSDVERLDTEGEFATTIKKEKQRTLKKEAVLEEIAQKKKDKYFLTTELQITKYRDKRKIDIAKAITEAKKLEDK